MFCACFVCRLVDFISLRSGQLSGAGGSSSVPSLVLGSGKRKRFVASVRGSILCFLWVFSELGRFLFFFCFLLLLWRLVCEILGSGSDFAASGVKC